MSNGREAHPTAVDEEQAWRLIGEARAIDPSPEAMARHLVHVLTDAGNARHIQRFDEIFSRWMLRCYRWDLWGVSGLVSGGHGDQESFMAFRSWLISLGEQVFDKALEDPDSLAPFLVSGPSGEPLCYVARDAYEAVEGSELPTPTLDLFAEPHGQPIPASDLTTQFPKIAAALGLS